MTALEQFDAVTSRVRAFLVAVDGIDGLHVDVTVDVALRVDDLAPPP